MKDVAREIEMILEEEGRLAREAVEQAARKVARDTVNRLKRTSPKRTGKYAGSWTLKGVKVSTGTVSFIVHNKRGQLTHLLERGHALRGGGRTRAFPHIKPAEEQAIKDYEEELIKIIEKG